MTYYGDIAEDATITFFFTSKVNGVPTALAGSPALSVYKDGGATESAAGITLTADFDSRNGMNKVVIDTSADAFYVTGSDYDVVITTGTLNGQTQVGVVVGSFSIQNRYNDVNVASISGDSAAADNAEAFFDNTGFTASNSTIGTCTTNTDMRGTDSAALASVCTEARLAELDAANIPADVDEILTDTAVIGAAGAGLSAVPWNAAWDAEVQSEVNDALVALGLDHLVSAAVVGADVTDNSIIARLVSKSATADWDDFVNTSDSLQALRDTLALETTVAALNNLSEAQVNAQMVDVMNTDTITLPGQEAPPLAPTHRQAIGWLYKVLRNRKDQTATLWQLYADDQTTVDAKATASGDGTTVIKQEIVSGP